MDISEPKKSKERQATRLRELMRNRFKQEVAFKLIHDFGGELEALDFLLSEKEDVVQEYLQTSPNYVQDLRTDSQNLASILENGFESSVRMFGCGSCVKVWWRKVPIRKEVSQCTRCKVKYDPIPKDKEWGWGKFICQCGNEFTGHATMGETKSACYKCETPCPVDHILPPRRRTPKKKSRTPHSCNGYNCYNRDADDNYNQSDGTFAGYASATLSGSLNSLSGKFAAVSLDDVRDDRGSARGPAGAYSGPAPPPRCTHPKSLQAERKKLHYESTRHHSTGSTVTDVLSQDSLETRTVASILSLDRINEEA